LIDFDHFCSPDQQPVLVRPSLFTELISKSASKNLVPGQVSSGETASVLALYNDLRALMEKHPSDWHLEPSTRGYTSRLRFNGKLSTGHPVTADKGDWYLNSLQRACELQGSGSGKPLDGSFKIDDRLGNSVSLRISMIPSIHGLSLAVRFLYPDNSRLDSLTRLGMDTSQEKLLADSLCDHEGLVLVCGPTGSGKSTTLHALLRLSVQQNIKVLSVEDPVERIIPGVQQVQISDRDDRTFATVLKAFMRQSPDTILIGEIRDPLTAETVLQSAFSGHRILSTLHARDTAGAFSRFQDFGIASRSLKQALRLVIHQRLVPLLCAQCKISIPAPGNFAVLITKETGRNPCVLHRSSGCKDCSAGYAGRTAIFHMDQDLGSEQGLQQKALRLLADGKIDLQTAISHLNSSDRRRFSFHNCKDFAN
jgi:type II secretory ATPase GspE/PulE/Tfp pilus assembly ATPase PilB-like protein